MEGYLPLSEQLLLGGQRLLQRFRLFPVVGVGLRVSG